MHPVTSSTARIGLLGGSFNPAHGGHLHITRLALERLGLDEVWWLVSPKNPLKNADSLADYSKRLESAQRVTRGQKRVRVMDIESRLKTRFTYQTVGELQKRHAGVKFVWLMGADNLLQLHRWRRWTQLIEMLPIVVFDRAPYSHHALRSKAALRLRPKLMKIKDIDGVWDRPGLLYLHLRRDPLSSTWLRKTLGEDAFLGHNEGVKGGR